ILLKTVDQVQREMKNKPLIVPPLGVAPERGQRALEAGLVHPLAEHRAVQVLFGREMPKDDRLADAGRLSDGFGGGAPEAERGEEMHRLVDDLLTPCASGHARPMRTVRDSRAGSHRWLRHYTSVFRRTPDVGRTAGVFQA